MRPDKYFFQKDAVSLAKDLLGKLLIREIGNKKIICRIVETEAYVGPEDKACHAYNNRRTKRTEVMFNKGGCAYVYSIYGLHHCLNIVANIMNKPEAVLIRSVEPLEGLNLIKKYRVIKSKKVEDLTNGPGKLSKALNITNKLNNYDLINGSQIYIEDDGYNNFDIVTAKRINIDYAKEYKDKLWRFYLKNSGFISKQ